MFNRPRRCQCTAVAAAAPKGAGRFTEWLGISASSRPAKRNPGINCDVDANDYSREYELDLARQPGWINDLDKVVLDEASRVA